MFVAFIMTLALASASLLLDCLACGTVCNSFHPHYSIASYSAFPFPPFPCLLCFRHLQRTETECMPSQHSTSLHSSLPSHLHASPSWFLNLFECSTAFSSLLLWKRLTYCLNLFFPFLPFLLSSVSGTCNHSKWMLALPAFNTCWINHDSRTCMLSFTAIA